MRILLVLLAAACCSAQVGVGIGVSQQQKTKKKYTYYVDSSRPNDSGDGITRSTAFSTTAFADTVPLISGQTIGQKVNGAWVLYRTGPYSPYTYYVDSSQPDDTGNGLTPGTAKKTIAAINALTLTAGQSVGFKRGGVWRETLTPGQSGSAGNVITFNSYGTGTNPVFTGFMPLASGTWTADGGVSNVWNATVTAANVRMVQFGGIWGGTAQASKAACTAARNWYFASNTLSVYATSNPATLYGSVQAVMLPGLIDVNAKTYLTFKNLALTGFDTYGAQTRNASNYITFDTVLADSNVPRIDAQNPVGFNIGSTTTPATIVLTNVESDRNAGGVLSTVSGVTLVNSRVYANRNYGILDNGTAANLTYSYSTIFGNNISTVGWASTTNDVMGSTNGGNNTLPWTVPASLPTWSPSYPAHITITVDDLGNTAAAPYITDHVAPVFAARGLKWNTAVMTSWAQSSDITLLNSWWSAGFGIDSHSWSHEYFQSAAAAIRYIGNATTATVTISGNTLTTALAGQSDGSTNLSLDLTNASYDTIAELCTYINTQTASKYTCGSRQANSNGMANSKNLADVAAHDIKTSYSLLWDKARLIPDEMTLSMAWLNANISGYTPVAYDYPGTQQDSATWGYAVTAGWLMGRGDTTNLNNKSVVASVGINVQDVMSQAVGGIHGLSQSQINGVVQDWVLKAKAWGLPLALDFHAADGVTDAELGYMLDAMVAAGAVVETNAQLATYIRGQTQVGTTQNFAWAGQ